MIKQCKWFPGWGCGGVLATCCQAPERAMMPVEDELDEEDDEDILDPIGEL